MSELIRYHHGDENEGLIVEIARAVANSRSVQLAKDTVTIIADISTGVVTHCRNEARNFALTQLAQKEVMQKFDAMQSHFKTFRSAECASCYNFCLSIRMLPDNQQRISFMALPLLR